MQRSGCDWNSGTSQIEEFYYRHVAVTVTELETKIWQVLIPLYFFL